jgi:hypothetical protein
MERGRAGEGERGRGREGGREKSRREEGERRVGEKRRTNLLAIIDLNSARMVFSRC